VKQFWIQDSKSQEPGQLRSLDSGFQQAGFRISRAKSQDCYAVWIQDFNSPDSGFQEPRARTATQFGFRISIAKNQDCYAVWIQNINSQESGLHLANRYISNPKNIGA
jgi:hypothetical protein